MSNNIFLSIKNISKEYKNKDESSLILDNVSLDIYKGEFISIVGTSGCGKSTLLNIIASLDTPTKGYVNAFNNDIGYMMQDSALFPWLNIEKNANLASKIKRIDNKNYTDSLLKKYNLYKYKNKFPKDLSGGMKQRVSLIRTISSKPGILLLDEPFSQLDYQTRLHVSLDVYNLVKNNKLTIILITHDISEAVSLSDRVVVLSDKPAKIKNIYNLKIDKNLSPIERRKTNEFIYYYDKICDDLELFNNE